MRSDFFNQVRENRQRFYLQLSQQTHEISGLHNESVEVEHAFSTSSSISLPEFRIRINEIPWRKGYNKTTELLAEFYTVVKPYSLKFSKLIKNFSSMIVREINKGYQKSSAVLGIYAERCQMFIYSNLIGFFEEEESGLKQDHEGHLSYFSQPQSKSMVMSRDNSENTPLRSTWFRRFFGKILISLELDDLHLNSVEPPQPDSEPESRVMEGMSHQKKISTIILNVKKQLTQFVTKINPVRLFRQDMTGCINKLT
jgi:hypothetical protein